MAILPSRSLQKVKIIGLVTSMHLQVCCVYILLKSINIGIHYFAGWLSAKPAAFLDERSKHYTIADDKVSETVADLFRGEIYPAIKSVLKQGIKCLHFQVVLLIHGFSLK